MPTIKVNTTQLGRYESDLQGILSRVNSIMNQFDSVSRSLDWDVKAESNINSRLSAISRELSAESRGISGMKNYLDTAVTKYNAVENKNSGRKLENETTGRGVGARVVTKGKTIKSTAGWAARNGVGVTVSPNGKNTKSTVNTGAKKSDGVASSSGLSLKENAIKYLKKIGKSGLDALGKSGTYGKMGALPIALLKNIIDGDGITGKDIGSTIKGMGNSIIGMCDEYSKTAGKWPISTADIKELAGLSTYKTISTASTKAGWLAKVENFGVTLKDTLKSEISPISKTTLADGTKVVDKVKTGTKVAGWALSLVANGFSNYDEYSKGDITKGRAFAETISETLIDIGKGAAITAGVAATCAAIGVAAPAVVVGGIGVGVSLVADIVCENLTGKSVTEATSDFVLDNASKVGKAVTGAASNAKKAISGWFDKVISSSSTPQVSGAW